MVIRKRELSSRFFDGYKSATKPTRLAVEMKAAFFYDFVDKHIERIYNIDRLRRICYV